MTGLVARAVGRAAVFVLTDSPTKDQQEADVVVQMRRMGIEATQGHLLIPGTGKYSADGVATFLIKSGFKSFAEVRPKADSQGADFTFHYLEDTPRAHALYSKTEVPLNEALGMLAQALASLAADRK